MAFVQMLKKNYCDDYDVSDSKAVCNILKAHNNNKICSYEEGESNKQCNEIYLTCNNYNNDIEESKRNKDDCESIKPRDPTTKEIDLHSECYFNRDNKQCVLRKKECEDLSSSSELCNEHKLDDTSKPNKRCIFDKSKCKEIYKTCDGYNEIAKDIRVEDDCKLIESTDETEPFLFKCVFDNDDNKKCTKEKKECEDYKGADPDICSSLSKNLDNKHKSAIIGNSCVKQAKTCIDFNSEEEGTLCDSYK